MFEPRFTRLFWAVLGQPFHGWYRARHAGGLFSALGRSQRPSGAWGEVAAGRPWRHALRETPDPVTPLPKSHLPHSTTLKPPGPL